MIRTGWLILSMLVLPASLPAAGNSELSLFREYSVPAGAHPHDVAPARDGGVWYTAQHQGALGHLDPKTGETRHFPLGEDSSPHGVIVGPDGFPWITDSGMNAILRVDPATGKVTSFPLPMEGNANLNTAAFDNTGTLWFTGQNGYYGRVAPETGKVDVFKAPGGRGPYGITSSPDGSVWYASLAGSHIARIDAETGKAAVVQPHTPDQGARRVWADSRNRVWVSEWNSGQVSMYDPAKREWKEWKLPGKDPRTYAVYVDENDMVWLSDFGANAIVRFDPETEKFRSFPLPGSEARVRQILGRAGEVWLPESGRDRIAVICDACYPR
jgi:virginiamycin B lyase